MSCPSQMTIFFFIQVFFQLYNGVVSNEQTIQPTRLEDWKNFTRSEDGAFLQCQSLERARISWPDRLSKDPVHITFDDSGTVSTTTLYVVEDDDLISPRRTGMWTASSSPSAYQTVIYTPSPRMFDAIGDFQFLQNAQEGSALTRFFDSNGKENIIGILKQKYTVQTALRDQTLIICKNAAFSQESLLQHNYEDEAFPNPNSDRSKRQSRNVANVRDVVYPKLLIVPDFNTVKPYTNMRDFMMQLIAQLNSIDMMFRQLKEPEVHLNIAGIIIPSDNGTTPYISRNIDADNRIYGPAVVFQAESSFANEFRRFPPEKWDALLILTAYSITSYNIGLRQLVNVDGFSTMARGCSGAAAITRFSAKIEGTYTSAHELSKMFREKYVGTGFMARLCANVNDYVIVSRDNNFSKLEWSSCSRAAFQAYFRSDAGNCTHFQAREVPDAMKSMPGIWLTLEGQCDNLHNNSTNVCIVRIPNRCFIYGCEKNDLCSFEIDPPLEGSLLLNESENQVCRNGTMVSV